MDTSFISTMKEVFQEAFEGPQSEGSCFTNSRPNTGIFGTLDELSAKEASIPVNGATIAAHADHTRYYLRVIRMIFDGKTPEKDWEASWKISEVDETEWHDIRKDLKKEYEAALKKMDEVNTDEQFSCLLGDLAHSAYHLGALRQLLKAVKEK